jgi:GT2 family glycosyltransferase
MDLSVIIVSYNVKYFLEQCLHAVERASRNYTVEIFVVDNNSVDGSAQMVAGKFPRIRLIANTDNLGFARANNQAILLASGRYILLLNPDTLVQEDTFDSCLQFLDGQPDVGCLGVKMIDGKGNFLPESKRALPNPRVAFYKIFGLSSLFPRSETFGRYHLGFLDREKIHDVEVISGAFMLLRTSVLKETGFLDEAFFMYGEDIDLSYRITQAGFRNVYFPLTTIIHYKGESTKKGSFNYVVMFYKAMIIFARKHYTRNTARYYAIFINIAIYFRAALSIFQRFFMGIINPLLDAISVYAGYALILPVWEIQHFGQQGAYPPVYLHVVVPAYILIWILALFLTTGYERSVKLSDLIKGIILGSFVILLAYALLPETLRFSRALILFGTAWTLVSAILIRTLLSTLFPGNFRLEAWKRKKRIIIVGSIQESKRIFSIIRQTQVIPELIGFVDPVENRVTPDYIGHIGQIGEIVRLNRADELVFCGHDISSRQIITTMLQFTDTGLEFKIAPPESLSVIGSNSNDSAGELYILHYNTLSRVLNRRKKRMLDIALSLLIIIISPLLMLTVKEPSGLIRNVFSVLFGMNSWVGYFQSTGGNHPGLPRIRNGILTPMDIAPDLLGEEGLTEKINLNYAKDYRIMNDLNIIIKAVRQLGRRPNQPGRQLE